MRNRPAEQIIHKPVEPQIVDDLSGHMSIPKARKILGKYGKQLSDNQIGEVIQTLQLLARESLGYNGSKKVDTLNGFKN